MFIRQTKTSSTVAGDAYYTFRLVASERTDGKVRQLTVLNLGRNFSLPREQWPELSARIDQILHGQISLFPASDVVEPLAQHYAAILIARRDAEKESAPSMTPTPGNYQEVDIDSLELTQPRSVGVEHVGVAALNWLDFHTILADAGLNGVQRAVAFGSIIARMAKPGSEQASWQWLREQSAMGEFLDVDFNTMSAMRLYRVSDLLIKHREKIEDALFAKVKNLFSLQSTVTLYDLTNTYHEGEMAGNPKAKRGHSKEKRSDCPLITLGLVLDGSGFVRRSRMFEGSVAESTTLESMLQGLEAPAGALVIMDRGIATEANILWLLAHHYRYLVVSRERKRQFEQEAATPVSTASGQTVHIQKVVSEDGQEARLYCFSEERQKKESSMTARFCKTFEDGLQKLADGLNKPRCTKNKDKLLQRIGRLQQKSHGIGQHYTINLSTDENNIVTALTWERIPVSGSQLTHPGVYCLRTNELAWDETTLWRTYTMLTDLEAVFRSLKSELGMRPVYHHKEERAEGHLFITVLAYQAVQLLRHKLKAKDINGSWNTLRNTLSVQQRITATFKQRDGRTLHVRKSTLAEPKLKAIYTALGIPAQPLGVRKLIV
ncbi:MAG: IS1634 family transposase [Desulfobacteraceae bacterium]|nr:IS1634 family transposase [Desulfobacteraceae bacterium]